MSNKIYLPTGAYDLLKQMIILRDNGQESFTQMELAAIMKTNISYALQILIREKIIINRIKDRQFVRLFISHNITMDDVIERSRYSVKNPFLSKKSKPNNEGCPYKGRRYEDVAPGTYDPALEDRSQPSKQYNYSLNGLNICGAD